MKKILFFIKLLCSNLKLKIMTFRVRQNPKRKVYSQEQISNQLDIFLKCILEISGYKFSITGKEKLKNANNIVVISNHKSNLDAVAIQYFLPFLPGWFGKKSLFNKWSISHIAYLAKAYPLDRQDPRQSSLQFLKAKKDFENGRNLFIFPEGTRSQKEKMGDFKPLVFRFIKSLKADIIPIKLDYRLNKLNEDGSKNNNFKLIVLNKIKYDDYKDKEIERISKEIHSIINNAK